MVRCLTFYRKDDFMKKLLLVFGLFIVCFTALGADMSNGADNFYKSDKVITAASKTKCNTYLV
jgi:hypothetical protein